MKRLSAIVGAVFLCAALAGCGGKVATGAPPVPGETTAAQSSEPTSTPDATQTSPPPTESPAGEVYSGTAHITDKDGYTFDVDFEYHPVSFRVATASEKPGLNSVVVDMRTSIGLKNTTPGRTISFESLRGVTGGSPHFSLTALWKRSSPVCATISVTFEAEWCAMSIAYGTLESDLIEEASVKLSPVYSGMDDRGGGVAGVAHVPDADLDKVRTAMAQPDDYLIEYRGGDVGRFATTCPDPLGSDRAGNVVAPIFAKGGICHRYYPVAQPSSSKG